MNFILFFLYLTNYSIFCIECGDKCAECDSLAECTVCKDNRDSGNNCECNTGY